jgi:acetyl-CoA synthetase
MNNLPITLNTLIQLGIKRSDCLSLIDILNTYLKSSPSSAWKIISTQLVDLPFSIHLFFYEAIFPHWRERPDLAPAVLPGEASLISSNLALCMAELGYHSYQEFHAWSHQHYNDFWSLMLSKLDIQFKHPPSQLSQASSAEMIEWLPGAKFNIVDSCFNASKSAKALIYLDANHQLASMTFQELANHVNCIANSLVAFKITPGTYIAIDMPMSKDAVALYLAIIKMGAVVVSIADSFSTDEISARLRITNTSIVFTQDYIVRGEKRIPLYSKVAAANPQTIIVIQSTHSEVLSLREADCLWDDFLVLNTLFDSHACSSADFCNILFSSGTTGDPKAIPWLHSTPIKVASDAFFHQNIQPNDVLTWPTNLGWMMGPWLIFAAFINQATIALYTDSPNEKSFGEFVQNAQVTMLGVIPTLVTQWRLNKTMEEFDWQHIKVFSSTGECSNSEDMLYLMHLANYKPIIEYCGGTEIGGSYLTSTILQDNCPAVFTTPAMGLDLILIDDKGQPTTSGEVALIPPSIGLSNTLLNGDHHHVYYDHMPQTCDGKLLRRHGDQLLQYSSGFYSVLGRADDTMNIGGIKVSSAEIERVLVGLSNIKETAAIGVKPIQGGPSLLVIFAVVTNSINKGQLKSILQQQINQHLNPLFKIHDLVLLEQLPKTATNKVMRRTLRLTYDNFSN